MPSRTACDLLPATVARLAELPGIIGLKEAVGMGPTALIKRLVAKSGEPKGNPPIELVDGLAGLEPVGELTLVASDNALVAILWPNDDPARVRLGPLVEASDDELWAALEIAHIHTGWSADAGAFGAGGGDL